MQQALYLIRYTYNYTLGFDLVANMSEKSFIDVSYL